MSVCYFTVMADTGSLGLTPSHRTGLGSHRARSGPAAGPTHPARPTIARRSHAPARPACAGPVGLRISRPLPDRPAIRVAKQQRRRARPPAGPGGGARPGGALRQLCAGPDQAVGRHLGDVALPDVAATASGGGDGRASERARGQGRKGHTQAGETAQAGTACRHVHSRAPTQDRGK
jgi:hypothetical protein